MQKVRRLIVAILVFGLAGIVFAKSEEASDVVLLTWNMKWFPSGKADLRISREIEDFKIRSAAAVVSNGVLSVGGSMSNGVIACVQEVRNGAVCGQFSSETGIVGLRVVAASEFLDQAGVPIWQQCAILSNLPVEESGAMPWQSESHVEMPRGFSYAVLGSGNELIAVFCVHLKSNLNWSGSELENQKNIYKREFAAAQVLVMLKELQQRYGERLTRVAVAGDFNTNEDEDSFVSESTLRSFYGAHFRSCFRRWKKHQRVTHPASGGYPDATFDYILYRGFGSKIVRRIYSDQKISDHNLVCIRLMMN